METWWSNALWWQFGAAIDMLENALGACPDSLWRQPVWPASSDPSQGVEFWYVPYHALFWLDLYLSATLEGFAPPAPFTMAELDPAGALPERPYAKDELRAYLAYARQKGQTMLVGLTQEQARQPLGPPWAKGKDFTYLELQLYNLRHVQEHAAQLQLFLGQHAIQAGPSWVSRAKDDPDSKQAPAE
jgi:DinB superfamily